MVFLINHTLTVDSDVTNLFLNCNNKALNLGYLVNLVTQDVTILVSVNLSKEFLGWGGIRGRILFIPIHVEVGQSSKY